MNADDLAMLTIPGPTIVELTRPFWEAVSEGRLLIQGCRDCGQAIFYPREICPHCWNDNVDWRDAKGDGRLKSFSIVHKPGHPGWEPVSPYVVGLVQLDEGPTMLSHILKSETEPVVGARLKLKPTMIGGRMLPAFEIVDGETHD